MNRRKFGILVLSAICAVALFCVSVPATINPRAMEDDTFGICALEGLKGVTVRIVRSFSVFEEHRFKRDPINDGDLQARVEGTLRRAGIRVFENSSQDPGIAQLAITVNTWKTQLLSQCILQVSTELYQLSELVRGSRLRTMAPTWPVGQMVQQTEMTAVTNRSHISLIVANEIERQIEAFINDYLTANLPMMTGTIRPPVRPAVVGRGPCCEIVEIVGDDGVHYRPLNLPHEFRKHGLRVRFRFSEKACHAWGKTVKIIWIRRL